MTCVISSLHAACCCQGICPGCECCPWLAVSGPGRSFCGGVAVLAHQLCSGEPRPWQMLAEWLHGKAAGSGMLREAVESCCAQLDKTSLVLGDETDVLDIPGLDAAAATAQDRRVVCVRAGSSSESVGG